MIFQNMVWLSSSFKSSLLSPFTIIDRRFLATKDWNNQKDQSSNQKLWNQPSWSAYESYFKFLEYS